MSDPAEEFAAFAQEHGYDIGDPEPGGHVVRFAIQGDKGKKKSGWYLFHNDNPANGAVGDWLCASHRFPWRTTTKTEPIDMRAIERERVERAARIEREQAAAALIAQMRWRAATPIKGHPYLTAKQIKPHGVRREGQLIIMPIIASNGDIVSMQSIGPIGEKRFQPKGKKEGGVYLIGDRPSRTTGPIAIAEGFATAATVNEATGWPVFVAFDASNMVAVSHWLAKRFAGREWIVCGDDDWHLPERLVPLANAGLNAANRAAVILSGRAVFPRHERQGTDFNDQAKAFGLDSVNRTLTNYD